MNFGKSISETVTRFRVESKYSQFELGKMLGYTGQYVSNVERGANLRPVSFCLKLMTIMDPKRADHLEELLKEAVFERFSRNGKKKKS